MIVFFAVPRDSKSRDVFNNQKPLLEADGADCVALLDGPVEDWCIIKTLSDVITEAFAKHSLPPPEPTKFSADKLSLLFEMMKCRSGFKQDLLCAGGLLDLVRGSIMC